MLSLYEPKYDDLYFRQMILADKETMSYNNTWGGTISFPEKKGKTGMITGLLITIINDIIDI